MHVFLFILKEIALHLFHDLQGFRFRRSRAELDFHGQDALILVGQKRRGHTPQDPARAHEHGQIYDHHPAADLDDPADGPPVGRGRPVETPVEPAEEAVLRGHVAGLQKGGAQYGRQHHRHDNGKDHGRHDGQRELAVDGADGAAEKGHRHEHGGQHRRHADERAGDLAHRLDGGLARRQPVLFHDAGHVFDHDDGIVHKQADCQHHAEHRQRIDAEPERRHDAERAEQNHGNRQRRDDCGPEVLEEQVDDREHQHDGLKQGLDHLDDGNLDERNGIVGRHHFHAVREIGAHVLNEGRHRI